ncbi:hypothetical protein J3R83DRAFT_13821 [Lanmaoa asiatica]|nr:hypothetical protein J3R83DRAFT_13821 [Lanmaoa asiatica]
MQAKLLHTANEEFVSEIQASDGAVGIRDRYNIIGSGVAIVLQGRQAGKKVVVIKQLDEGTKERPYPHAIVAGIERYPPTAWAEGAADKQSKAFHQGWFPFGSHFAISVISQNCNVLLWSVIV